uniref:Uncharacterized protein n=1 Tax=virus sp. ctoYX9 TaxID=2825822 RepID=A0A8S5RPB6_9VIRU|nr:MAG TPA: hypothetical protein [virus sp. ctoYX9]
MRWIGMVSYRADKSELMVLPFFIRCLQSL